MFTLLFALMLFCILCCLWQLLCGNVSNALLSALARQLSPDRRRQVSNKYRTTAARAMNSKNTFVKTSPQRERQSVYTQPQLLPPSAPPPRRYLEQQQSLSSLSSDDDDDDQQLQLLQQQQQQQSMDVSVSSTKSWSTSGS